MGDMCQIQWLGQVEYGAAWRLQKELADRRAANEIPDVLLLLEHPHTYTIGVDGHREHLLLDQEEMARLDIGYYEVDRAGSVTYHGPGQLVAYPILNLREHGLSYHRYLATLESLIIRSLLAFKIQAFRQAGQRGVWVIPGNIPQRLPQWVQVDHHIAKIGGVGVNISRCNIAYHGFFINVAPDLSYFDWIIPCGIQGCKITSLEQILNKTIPIGTMLEPVIESFCELFKLEPQEMDLPLPADLFNMSYVGEFVPS